MGDVYVEITLENYIDRILSQRGYLELARIRAEKIRVLADSGSTMLVLPQDLVERLGLEIRPKKVIVTYADERKEERPVAGTLTVRVGDRSMETDCVVTPLQVNLSSARLFWNVSIFWSTAKKENLFPDQNHLISPC